MSFRFALVSGLFLAALAACGETTEPPATPQPRPAVVALRANDVLVFAGQPVALERLVWRVTDPAGNVLTDYELDAQLPAGWTIRNDTVIAPANETVARLKVTATYLPTAATQFAAPLFDEVPTDTTDTATVTAGVDLKGRVWQFEFRCSNVGYSGINMPEPANEAVDSVHVIGTVDSVTYAADSGWIPQFGGTAQIRVDGRRVFWGRNGSIDTSRYEGVHTLMRQAPDTLTFGSPSANDRHHAVRVTPGTLQQLLRYEGGTWCPPEYRDRRGLLTFEEIAAP